MRKSLKKVKIEKIKNILIILLIGIIPLFFINDIIIQSEDFWDNLPYDYGSGDGQIQRFPDYAIYTNMPIEIIIHFSAYEYSLLCIVMDIKNYLEFDNIVHKDGYSVEEGIDNIEYIMLVEDNMEYQSSPCSYIGWFGCIPPYLDWWCVYILFDGVWEGGGGCGFGYGASNKGVNAWWIPLIITGVFFIAIVILYYINKRFDLLLKIRQKNKNKDFEIKEVK